jgi:hypothetical protein
MGSFPRASVTDLDLLARMVEAGNLGGSTHHAGPHCRTTRLEIRDTRAMESRGREMMKLRRKRQPRDFEQFGYQIMRDCGNAADAAAICGLEIHAEEKRLQPERLSLQENISDAEHHITALHAALYDRTAPVNDAAMLTHGITVYIMLVFAVMAASACVVGNVITFLLLGFDLVPAIFSAVGMTAVPLLVGHLAYEWFVAKSRVLQILVVVATLLLCGAGILKLGQARGQMIDKAVSASRVDSYVDDANTDSEPDQEAKPPESGEAKIHSTFGDAMLLFMIAAEIVLGFLVGQLVRMYGDEDYAAWRKLKGLRIRLIRLRAENNKLIVSIEISKRTCLAGILRAQNEQTKRRPPYHRAAVVTFFCIFFARSLTAQNTEHYEGILIDTSASISRGGRTNELFREYLLTTRRLLMTEPPNTRVWVEMVSSDSFGGVREVLKGWTPDARGVFTDGLNRARRQLASSFEKNSSAMSPVASATDIFGALWRLKATIESDAARGASSTPKTIWVFSDMMNETQDFSMPELIEMGPESMLERAKANGLLVPLNGYRVHVLGASPSGLSPQLWTILKRFWTIYFSAAGADLVSYSVDCTAER